ncbi:MAG: polysaccharide pyruvyl transferase family protein [Proteobacteria bacterium]|nr:polysaccharide pyruvyl transferase family protein [Pseudomonadota bacterium]
MDNLNRKSKKIGLCIAYRENHNNFGTSLVGFALTKVVQSLGYSYEIIHYRKERSIIKSLLDAPFILISGGLNTLKNRIKVKINLKRYFFYAQGIKERTSAVNTYKKLNLIPLMRTYKGFNALKKGSLNYDLIIVGSDQVWLPLGLYKKFFNLLFVNDRIPKMAYSSSFGVSKIPIWQKKKTRYYLNRFDAIGVREIKGKEIVEKNSNNSATVVLDPTLLVPNKEWEKELRQCSLVTSNDYIFCYLLGNSRVSRDAVNQLKEKTGLPIVFCPHMDEYVKDDDNFGDYSPYAFTPNDFVNHIKHARYVCTDSFHATIFSIHFEKKFLTFYRFNSKSSNSRNSRIDSLFSLLNLENRLFQGDVSAITQDINYKEVLIKLSKLRENSLSFLESNIRKCTGEVA